MHGSKCQKCNGLYKLEHYREIAWCCKANFKTNPLRFETKKGELCTCLNVLTARANTRQTITTVHSGNADLRKISTARSCKSFEKSELI